MPPIRRRYPILNGLSNLLGAAAYAVFGDTRMWPVVKVASIIFQVLFRSKTISQEVFFFPFLQLCILEGGLFQSLVGGGAKKREAQKKFRILQFFCLIVCYRYKKEKTMTCLDFQPDC